MKIMCFFFVYVLLALSACHKEILPPVPLVDAPVSKLNILWQKPLVPDTSNHTTSPQCFIDGGIIYSVDFTSPTATVQMRNGVNGDQRWIFDNFLYPIDAFIEFGTVMPLHNQLAIHYWHRDYCVDVQSGQRIWASDISGTAQGSGPLGATIGDYLYTPHYTGQKPKSTSESLARHHYSGGGWDTLVTFTAAGDNYHPNLKMPTLWINPQGDSVLIIRNYEAYSAPPSPPNGRLKRMGIYAFNLRTRTFDWQREDFDVDGIATAGDVLIEGNHLYINTTSKLHCVDLFTGQTIWKKQFNEAILSTTLVMHQNIVVVQNNQRGMWGIDKDSGAEVWYQPETDGNVDELAYFDGVVYCTSTGYGRLYAVRAADGKLIWAEQSPNRGNPRTADASFSYSTVVVDPERRVLYVGDHYYMMCIKVPE